MRRRALHGALAEALERVGGQAREIARHWLGARVGARARESLLRAADESEAVHAYRDAAAAGRQALELWPESGDEDRRGEVLERYARCSQLAGELAEAEPRVARAVRDARRGRRSARRGGRPARAGGRARAARRARGRVRGAADRRRGLRGHGLHRRGGRRAPGDGQPAPPGRRPRQAIELARTAREEADAAGRVDLRIRALGLEGLALAKHGDYEGGLQTVSGGLALALEHDLTAVAAELYQRLSVTLYEAADLPARRGGARHRAAAVRGQPGRRHGDRVRDVHGVRPARARGVVAAAEHVPRADRRGHRRLRRRGPARRDPRLRGQARLRRAGCSPPRSPSRRA